MGKFSPRNTRSRKKCDIQFSKCRTVNKSQKETDSKNNKAMLAIIYPKKQHSYRHRKRSACINYKEVSDSEGPEEKMTKFASQSTRPLNGCETQFPKYVTVNKSKKKANTEDSVLTIFYPKKQFSKQHLKCSTSTSYKEASNSEEDESPKEKMATFSSRGTRSRKKCETRISKFVIVSGSKSETDSGNFVGKVQTKTSRKKQFSKRRLKCPNLLRCKEALNSEGNDCPEKKMANLPNRNSCSRKKYEALFSKSPKLKLTKFSFRNTSSCNSKYVTVRKSESETDSENNVKDVQTTSQKKQFSKRRMKFPNPVSYKEASNSEGIDSPEEKMTKNRKTYFRKKYDSQFSKSPKEKLTKESSCDTGSRNSKYVTVIISESETDSENNGKELQTKTSRKKQLSKRLMKCPNPVSYKEASNTEDNDSPEEQMTKLSSRNSNSYKKYESQFSNSEGSFEEIIIYPQKLFSNQHIKCPTPSSYKEAPNFKGNDRPEEQMTKLSSRKTHSPKKCSISEEIIVYPRKRFSNRLMKCSTHSSYKKAPNLEGNDSPEEQMTKLSSRNTYFPKKGSNSEEIIVYPPKRYSNRRMKRSSYKEASNSEGNDSPEVKMTKLSSRNTHSYKKYKSQFFNSEDSFEEIIISPQTRFSTRRMESPTPTSYKETSGSEGGETPKQKTTKFSSQSSCSRNSKYVTVSKSESEADFETDVKKMQTKTARRECFNKQCVKHSSPVSCKDVYNLEGDESSKEIPGLKQETAEICNAALHKENQSDISLVSEEDVDEELHGFFGKRNRWEFRKCSKKDNRTLVVSSPKSKGETLVKTNENITCKMVEMVHANSPPSGKKKVTRTSSSKQAAAKSFKEDLKTIAIKSTIERWKTRKCSVNVTPIKNKNDNYVNDQVILKDDYVPETQRNKKSVPLTPINVKSDNNNNINTHVKDQVNLSSDHAFETQGNKGVTDEVQKSIICSILSSERHAQSKVTKINGADSLELHPHSILFSQILLEKCDSQANVSQSTNAFKPKKGRESTAKSAHCEVSNDYMNNNPEDHSFCYSEDQLTSEKKVGESPERDTPSPDNMKGVMENPLSAGFESNVKPETFQPAMVCMSQGNVPSRVSARGACGMQSNNVELESEADVSEQPSYFHSKKVSRRLKDSIKRRKMYRTNTSSEEWKAEISLNNLDGRRHSPRLQRFDKNSKKTGVLFTRKKAPPYFMCVQCNQTVPSSMALYEHLCSGKRKKGYLCYICEKIFKLRSQLKKHERFHLGHRFALDENFLP